MRALVLMMALAAGARADDILAFTRDGCAPCERFKSDVAKDPNMAAPHAIHLRDARSELADSYGVRSVPAFIRLRSGREVARKVGYAGREDLKYWLGER